MTLAQDRLAEDRSLNSRAPSRFLSGYRSGLRHDRQGTDTEKRMRSLAARGDFPQIAGYIEGLAAAQARKPEVIEALRRWQRRDQGPGHPPKQRPVRPDVEEAS